MIYSVFQTLHTANDRPWPVSERTSLSAGKSADMRNDGDFANAVTAMSDTLVDADAAPFMFAKPMCAPIGGACGIGDVGTQRAREEQAGRPGGRFR